MNVEKNNGTVCVVLVTYNRKELLREVLEDLYSQTYPISAIIMVDNNSTDGTFEYLMQLGIVKNGISDSITTNKWRNITVYYYRSSENTGGSGGFEKAFHIAEQMDYDYIWAMDDDVKPESDCLEILINNIDSNAQVCIPSRTDSNWDDYIVTDYNLTNPFLFHLLLKKKRIHSDSIENEYEYVVDMPLEGPLISMSVAKKVGTPNGQYFIMYDDTDFAYRLSRETNIKYIVKAKLHRKLVTKNNADNKWGWKQYYLLRNSFWFDSLYGKNMLVRRIRPFLSARILMLIAVFKNERYKLRIIRRAYEDYHAKKMGRQIEPGTSVEEF